MLLVAAHHRRPQRKEGVEECSSTPSSFLARDPVFRCVEDTTMKCTQVMMLAWSLLAGSVLSAQEAVWKQELNALQWPSA